MNNQEAAYNQIESLVQRFKGLTPTARKGMNENATRQGYILPLFRALGWNYWEAASSGWTRTGRRWTWCG